MQQIPALKFKENCSSIMNTVRATGKPVVITKRGAPLVKLVPAERQNDIFGFMAGEFRIVGDIESPAVAVGRWRVLRKTNRKGGSRAKRKS